LGSTFADTQRIPEDRFKEDSHRPKVALVLAGGGAKGLAHIGVIKVLEEAGLPIDIVVGNSMGSIVGGLYAIGYNAHQMDSVVRVTNWMNLLLDAPDYDNNLLTAKKMNETYQLRVSLNPERRTRKGGRSGFIEGKNISQLLRHLTEGFEGEQDFNRLPRPFACNATEVYSGKVYEFHDGVLAEAMRSSMAIPGVFTPIHKDSLLFVDGFVTNNYPVDVARRMGADIIVGIDLVSYIPEEERYNNFMDLMTHMIDLSSTNQYDKNIKDTQLYIDVDVTEFTSASFGPTEIDTLLQRGENRARQLLPQICLLRDSLLALGHEPYHKLSFANPDHSEKDDVSATKRLKSSIKSSSLNIGARFDNDEYASVQAGATIHIPTTHGLVLQLYTRLGQRMKGGVSFRKYFRDNSRLTLSYLFEDLDLKYYYMGTRAASILSKHQRTRFYFSQEWNKIQYTFGTRYDWHHYSELLIDRNLSHLSLDYSRERYFTYFAEAEFNSLNSQYFPKKGSFVGLSMQLVTDNLISYKEGSPLPIVSLQWQTSLPLSSRFTLTPHARGRVLITGTGERVAPLALHNVIGGMKSGMKLEQQLTMAGIADMEFVSEDGILFGGFDMQQRIGANHYFQASVDGGTITNDPSAIVDKDNHTWGAQIGYSYDTGAGPLSLTWYWSDRTKKSAVLFNIGYCF